MMKYLAVLSLASAATAHYFFPDTIVDGVTSSDWEYIRDTDNDPVSFPVTDFNSPELACFQNVTKGAPQVLSIAAGTQIAFKSSNTMGHPGPQMWYMAKVPSGSSVTTWDPIGQESFFKISERGAINEPYLQFETGMTTPNTTIPNNLEKGDYLLRFEHIALHTNIPQFYIACAQVTVTGSGTDLPTSNLVAFPGAYKPTDPGFTEVYIATPPYQYPGPPVAII